MHLQCVHTRMSPFIRLLYDTAQLSDAFRGAIVTLALHNNGKSWNISSDWGLTDWQEVCFCEIWILTAAIIYCKGNWRRWRSILYREQAACSHSSALCYVCVLSCPCVCSVLACLGSVVVYLTLSSNQMQTKLKLEPGVGWVRWICWVIVHILFSAMWYTVFL